MRRRVMVPATPVAPQSNPLDEFIQPEPPPAPTVDDLLAARGVTRGDVAYTLRGLVFPWQGWQVDYVVWGDPLVIGFVHNAKGVHEQFVCDIADFPSDALKAFIVKRLGAVS